MARDDAVIQKQLREGIARTLHPGEVFLSSTFARVPFRKRTQQGTTFVSIAGLLFVIDLFLWKWRRSKAVQRANEAGFPVSPNIYLVATGERFLYVEALGRKKYVGNVLGEVPRSSIGSVSLPYRGEGRWKLLFLTGRKGGGMRFVVPRAEGEEFVSAVAMPPELVDVGEVEGISRLSTSTRREEPMATENRRVQPERIVKYVLYKEANEETLNLFTIGATAFNWISNGERKPMKCNACGIEVPMEDIGIVYGDVGDNGAPVCPTTNCTGIGWHSFFKL
ncbi:MAG TPA: hypothetical protein VMU77_03445 [Acidimicrobiales bacterium]|nr:hypothetical protein [Acidimicrobiales bacterium]